MRSHQTRQQSGFKVAIVGTRGIPARHGGFETFAQELSVDLVRRGVDVTVYCEVGEEDGPAAFNGVWLEYVPSPRLGPLTTILFDLRCLWHARNKYDVVYMLGYGTSIFCFLPRLWGTTVWINMDGVEWARSKWGGVAKLWFKFMEAAAMWSANRVIADAQAIEQHLRSRHSHVPPCDVIPYGAPVINEAPDTALLDEWGLARGNYYLVVCRLEPENNVQEIVRGYLRTASRRPLIVLGSIEPATEYVQELLLMKNERVRFVGTVYDASKLQALRYCAFAYFHGHTVGGTNPSLLEALGCGNPVIAHDNLFNREVAGETASYFKHEEGIAEIMHSLESLSAERLNEWKARSRERVRQKYTWTAVNNAYFRLLTGESLSPEFTSNPWPEVPARGR